MEIFVNFSHFANFERIYKLNNKQDQKFIDIVAACTWSRCPHAAIWVARQNMLALRLNEPIHNCTRMRRGRQTEITFLTAAPPKFGAPPPNSP